MVQKTQGKWEAAHATLLTMAASSGPVNGAPPKRKAPGGLDFGPAVLDELHHPLLQIQRISFHARKPTFLCANVNMNF